MSVIRAFTYFSHLANLTDDRHHIRRRAIHKRAGLTQKHSIDMALQRLRWAGITPKSISHLLATSYVSPMLAAHPSEEHFLGSELSMIQLPPSLLQPFDADRLRGAQLLREKAHAQLFQ